MLVSVIICTIRRDEMLTRLLNDLAGQTHRGVEVLIVGKEDTPPTEEDLNGLRLRRIPAPKGMEKARNAGMKAAEGDIVCYLDDDVTLEPAFFEKAVAVFENPEYQDVGGLTGYDHKGAPAKVGPRWRLRRLLLLSRTIEPGAANYMGRSVPLSFFQPFSGCRRVYWLPGFCQMYRKTAIEGLLYDEHSVTEDRDFSMDVAERGWRLMLCGDMALQHLWDAEARLPPSRQARRAAFGLGRSFMKRKRKLSDWWLIVYTLFGEFVIDMAVLIRRPTMENLRTPGRRIDGYLLGLSSFRRPEAADYFQRTLRG